MKRLLWVWLGLKLWELNWAGKGPKPRNDLNKPRDDLIKPRDDLTKPLGDAPDQIWMTGRMHLLQVDTNASRVPQPERDLTDYGHRHFVNLISAIVLLSVGIAITWTMLAIDKYETNERCLASGRRECVQIYTPPRTMQTLTTPR